MVVERGDASRVVLPRDDAEHSTSLGYALTVLRSQRITVGHAFGLGGSALDRKPATPGSPVVARHRYGFTTWSQLDRTIRRYECRLGRVPPSPVPST